jgi:folate-binding protein YgfZ
MFSEAAYAAARQKSAFFERSGRGRIVVSGADRRSYLQGLLTNDIDRLAAGQGCYAAYLTAQGRMIADLHVFELGDVVLLVVPGEVKDLVLEKLDQFIFSEDVQLGDVTETFAELAVVGPDAADAIAGVAADGSAAALRELPDHGNRRTTVDGQPAIVARIDDVGVPAYSVFLDRGQADGFRAALARAGAIELDPPTAEVLRVEGGVPLFARDMDAETIPLEAGIERRAISMTKGCYVGQEVIVRVLHRGHGRIARKLVGVALDGGDVPPQGTAVHADGKDVGRVTSAVWSPALNRPIALAYVHRDYVAAGTAVSVGDRAAAVVELPFVEV